MSTSLYARTRASANRLINRYGAAVTLVRTTTGTVAADGSGRTGDTTSRTPTKVVFDEYDEKLVDGTRIQQGDRKAIMLAETDVAIDDVLEVSSTESVKVINRKPVNPGGTVIYIEAQVRR